VILDDPLDRVFALGVPDRRRAIALALAAAIVVHGGMAGAIRLRGEVLRREAPLLGAQEVVIEREMPPPPPPPPPEPEPPPSPPPQPPKVNENVTAPASDPSGQPDEAPAAEAAQAGEVLVQESEEEEEEDPDDPDENTFVTGDAGTYAGGMTASTGTSALAVHGSVVATGGVPGGIGTAAMAPKPAARDRSREAWLDVTSWDDCDFPGEADRNHIRNAVVEMKVTVRPNGTAHSVTIVDDPGFGFARTASACALKHKFAPAHDREGNNIWGTTPSFHVGFHR
jgi:protein TonB